MSFLAPLGLLLGLSLPIVVLFYLLKVRRHDEEVSSTFLWDDLIRDLAAHEPLQRLKWNVLLVLQLLVLALLSAAVARPFLERWGMPPVHAVLVLDASASMQATDVSPSRFGAAVEQARETLSELPEGSVTTILLAGAHPQVLAAATGDRRAADRALSQARPSGAAGEIREALLLARSLGGDPSARRIYLFTDGAFQLPPDLPDDLGWLRVVQSGQTGARNVGVTAVSSRPDPRENRRHQVFTRIENFGAESVSSSLTLTVDGSEVERREVELAPDQSLEVVFEELPAGARAATLSLGGSVVASTFGLDDDAHLVLAQRRAPQVLLVSPGNPFLEKILALLPNVELYKVQSRRYLAVEADRYDVVVFDDYLPPLLPRGNLFVVNPPERGPIRSSGEMRRPRVNGWERDDPLLAYVDVRDLGVNRARRLDLPRWARPLVTTADGAALLAAGQDGERRVVILPFDLRQSNLPLSPAFPILASNILAYLSPTGIVQAPDIRTGSPQTLLPLPQVERVRVTAPDGTSQEMKSAGSGPLAYVATDTPGVYRVQQIVAGGAQTVDEDLFASNLADREESDLRSRMGDALGSLAGGDVEPMALKNEVWLALAALAIPLLTFEWFWFHRRV